MNTREEVLERFTTIDDFRLWRKFHKSLCHDLGYHYPVIDSVYRAYCGGDDSLHIFVSVMRQYLTLSHRTLGYAFALAKIHANSDQRQDLTKWYTAICKHRQFFIWGD